jgi:arylsulfatase A-like enzyme
VPKDEFRGRSAAGLYGDYMVQVDAALGRVTAALEEHDMLDETMLVFTSDNGPVWFPEDNQRFGHRSSGPLRGIKGDLWEGGHRMPLVVRWQGKVKPGSTSAALVGLVDVLATAAEVVGRPLAGEDRLDTISFLPVLLGRSESGNRDTLLQTRGNTVAVRHGPWKLIPGLGSFGFSKPRHQKPEPGGPRGQLYNLDEDLGERNNLWLEKPDVVERLKKLVPQR